MKHLFIIGFVAWISSPRATPALRINVRANGDVSEEGGGFYPQDIIGNASSETVLIQYSLSDGTIVSQLTDFSTSSQVLRISLLGEPELGEPLTQSYCFLSVYPGDLIPPEAVIKLRQKHPDAVRLAEQDNGEVVIDAALNLLSVEKISRNAGDFCDKESIYTSHHELFALLEKANKHATMHRVEDLTSPAHSNYESLSRCYAVKSPDETACICSLRVCFNWFPCALKYCSNKDGPGEHRCGIKTCRKCSTFRYAVPDKRHCSWDEI